MKDLVGQGKPLYSSLDKAAGLLKRKVGTGSEFLKELMAIPGVKQTEVAERGLGELLNAPKMTHEQFLTALQSKPVPPIREKINDVGNTDDPRWLTREERDNPPEGLTHHEEYTIPGGDNYREMLIKLPNRQERVNELHSQMLAGNRSPEIEKEKIGLVMGRRTHPEVFPGRSGHFGGEPGILASMRLKDRKGPNGEKLLHLEELQSDWHQAGRDNGYKTGQEQNQIKELSKQYDALTNQRRELQQIDPSDPGYGAALSQSNDITPKLMALQEQMDKITSTANRGVPDAPFKKNWEEMALKRLVHHAAEKGYHGIVVTPGEEQADRYDLSKHVDNVSYFPDTKTMVAYKDNKPAVEKRIENENELEGLVGKDIAQKILNQPTKNVVNARGDRVQTLSGVDLKVGGEGMKGFYDKKVPNILNGIGKKYGVKTQLNGFNLQSRGKERTPEEYEQAVQDAGFTMSNLPMNRAAEFDYHPKKVQAHYFPITDQMRQDVLKNGLPLYKEGGNVHVGAATMDRMKYELANRKG